MRFVSSFLKLVHHIRNHKEMVASQQDELQRIFNRIDDLVPLNVFSTSSFDDHIEKADKGRKDTINAVNELDHDLRSEYMVSEGDGRYVTALFQQLIEIKGNLNWKNPDERIRSIPAGKVKPNPMLHKKIPIYHDGGGNFFAIDLDHDLHRSYGQIIWVDHEYDEWEVYASSLKEFILIIYFFVKELGVIDNGEGYDGEKSYLEYVDRTV
ncbi:T7SS effector LXG polymorphic toxin [Metabacillus rhizolycopersici]|uniref:SMI1/KNR4 family protein n=1 Tax=Metabacillus rhizolycopersici TaxID=2875709 RepID=A0ABS7UZG9_9BACI|nr:T7SS effector LXG polymorphic toxin [Metabacillus rhizolycopersici]MBZ5753347.1 SMI1/KNR4 family protein [Metabacillus rhizolycopersici]